MDGDLRVEQLERRVTRLEARVQWLERHRPPADAKRGACPTGRHRGGPPRPPVLPAAPPVQSLRPPTPTWPTGIPEPLRRPAVPTPPAPAPRPVPAAAAARALGSEPPLRPAATTPAVPPVPILPAAARRTTLPAVASSGWGGVPDAPSAHPPISLRDLEERFAGRALAWIGGFALVAAAVFFLSLAFSRGWINEPMRVLIGLVAGSVALGAGVLCFDRRNPLLGNVLTAVGLGIVSISLFAATRGYGLVPPEVGLLGALIAAVAAAAIAIRYDAREVAVFGLISALIAPPVMGASPTTLTLAFVAVTLVGTTAIALFRSWRWLPSIAFVLAAPQLASWLVGDPIVWQGLVALAGFWLVNLVAAAGEEVRIKRDDLRPSSATLVLANATFLLWGGRVLLSGDLAVWFGTFLALASVAHLAVGGAFLRRQGMEHLFGNLVAGTGVALVAIAVFVQFGAPVVPLAWGAEAVALTWLAVRRHHRWSALAALAIGSLAIAHLLALEYPLWRAGLPAADVFTSSWTHPEFAALLAVLAELAVAAVIVPIRWIRSALVGVTVLLAAHGVTFEATGPLLEACLAAVAVAGLAADRVIARFGTRDGFEPVASWSRFAWYGVAAALAAGMAAVLLFLGTEFPIASFGTLVTEPFTGPETLSLLVVLAGLAAAGTLVPIRWIRSALAGSAVLLTCYAMWFEGTGPTLVGCLVATALAGLVADLVLARTRTGPGFEPVASWSVAWYGVAASLAVGVGTIGVLLLTEFPIAHAGTLVADPFTGPETVSLLLAVAGLAIAGALVPIRWVRSALAAVGVLLVAYASNFEATGPLLAACLVLTALAALVIDRGLVRLGTRPGFEPVAGWSPFAWYATAAGVLAGAWAIALLFAKAFPPDQLGTLVAQPFTGPETVSLVVVLAGLLGAGAIVAVRGIRSGLVGIGVLLVAWALEFEVAGVGLIAAQVVLLPLAVLADRVLGRLKEQPRYANALALPGGAALLASAAGVVAWAAGAVNGWIGFLAITGWGVVTPPAIPFTDERALVGALLAGALLAAARWVAASAARQGAVLAAIAVGAWVVPFEVYADGVVVLWIGLAGLALLAARMDSRGQPVGIVLAGLLSAGAAVVAFVIVAPPTRLWVVDPTAVERAPLLAAWPLAFAALAAALYLAPRRPRLARYRSAFEVAAAAVAVYAASVATVDVFQRMAGGTIAVEELSKQAQVALSVCWTTLGAVFLGYGLAKGRVMPRHIGFGLLALATAKVFVVDLAAMDVAYRALVLAGLGVLLLVSAWLFTHLRGPRAGTPGLRGPRPAG